MARSSSVAYSLRVIVSGWKDGLATAPWLHSEGAVRRFAGEGIETEQGGVTSVGTPMPGDPLSTLRPTSTIVVTGPSGSGKTTLGCALADRLGWAFADADDVHSPEAREKMASGVGLSDADRAPWLDRLAALIAERTSGGPPLILACSALTRAYRQKLTGAAACVALVWLHVPEPVLRQRLETRTGHFAGADLLPSQLVTAERPTPDEGALVLDADRPLASLVDAVAAWI